jgi:imidazolonepropionase
VSDLAVINAGQLVTCSGEGHNAEERLGIIEDGAFLVTEGRVSWVGSTRDMRHKSIGKPRQTVDAKGVLVTPGFVDPHTHLAFAGSREDELERKIAGESYSSILASGGGIVKTIKETRKASFNTIVYESAKRVNQLLRNGVTTAEVKTGYGQNFEDEMKLLKAVDRMNSIQEVELVPTFLGLHATPPEFKRGSDYVEYAIKEMLFEIAQVKERPRFSDCFCEEGVFSREECLRYLEASQQLGFETKVHADEFTDSGGASLAAELSCVSADHLGSSAPSGIDAMATAGVVAVLLPGTSLFSGIPYANARSMIEAGCEIALGTDLSPNSWIESPQLVMSLACNAMRITPAEALLAITRGSARAIARKDLGALAVGTAADFVLHSIPGYRYLPYRIGGQYTREVYKKGRLAFSSSPD